MAWRMIFHYCDGVYDSFKYRAKIQGKGNIKSPLVFRMCESSGKMGSADQDRSIVSCDSVQFPHNPERVMQMFQSVIEFDE